ncbi:MAG: Trk system potassium transporter TrkA [Succinivibrio sp.]
MKIIILGAGYVGMELASYLAGAGHAVTLVDLPSARLEQIGSRVDLRVIQGNPSSPVVLRNAGAENTELLVAATADDEANITACCIGAFLFHIPRRIARIRSAEYLQEADSLFGPGGIPIDHVISPEHITCDDIMGLIELPGASAAARFFDGMLTCACARAQNGGKLEGKPYSEFEKFDARAALLSVYRQGRLLENPRGEKITPGDEVYYCCQAERALSQLSAIRPLKSAGSVVAIAGGSHVADALAARLAERFRVKLIEPDAARSARIADRLYGSEVEIYNADPTSLDFMQEEQLQRADLYIAASPSDETNIMSSLLLHRMRSVNTLAVIRGDSYFRLAESSNAEIDTVVSPNEATISALLSNIRQEGVVSMRLFRQGRSEAIELLLEGSRFSSRIIGRKPDAAPLPKSASLGLVLRGGRIIDTSSEGFVFEEGDRVLVFLNDHKEMRQLIRSFRPRAFWIPRWQ